MSAQSEVRLPLLSELVRGPGRCTGSGWVTGSSVWAPSQRHKKYSLHCSVADMIFLLPSSLAHLEGRQRTHTAKPATAAHCVLKDSRVNFEKTISPIHRLAATWPLSVGLEKLVMKSVFPDRESKFQTCIFFFKWFPIFSCSLSTSSSWYWFSWLLLSQPSHSIPDKIPVAGKSRVDKYQSVWTCAA